MSADHTAPPAAPQAASPARAPSPQALPQRLLRAALWQRAPWWLAVVLPWLLLRSLPGLAVCALGLAVDVWRLRQRTSTQWPRWLDAEVPALEDSSARLVHAASPMARLQQQRLLARLDRVVDAALLRRIVRSRARFAWPWLALSLAAAAAVWAWPHPQAGPARAPAVAAQAAASTLTLQVTPPAYTGVPAFDSAPRELQVPDQSRVRWCLQTAGGAQPAAGAAPGESAIELGDGSRLSLTAGCADWLATESVLWRWRGTRYTLRVLPDAAPVITVRAPDEMIRTLGATDTTTRIAVTVRDDYQVARASLHLTLARGSGENVRFSDRELPLPQGRDPRVRDWEKTWTLKELGMEPGDELYFFVRASDNAEPRPHISTSPTVTLRLPGPVAASEEASALPMLVKPENLRSQRQVIIDTEQLLADLKANPRPKPADVRARSENIASDQAQLRRRYGQFLGEESSLFGDADDHDHGAEHGAKPDLMAQFGHVHDQAENATLFDEATKQVLRRALSAMWDAEKALRAITPQPALPFEYRALEAIKQLQQADRIYLHRTAFVPPPLKEEKRLSGDVVGALSYRREQGAMSEAVPAALRELVMALADDAPLPALWSNTARAWIRERIGADEDRLAAQRAVQDVQDGCLPCRAPLRAWLRSGIIETVPRLQAQDGGGTAFSSTLALTQSRVQTQSQAQAQPPSPGLRKGPP
jgi:hypothetical protein